MIVGMDELLKLVKEKNIVENLSERELKNPEGAGFDLRLGELYRIKGDAFIGTDERKTPNIELVAKFEDDKKISHTIKPNEFYLGKTIEKVNIPLNMCVTFKPRSTTYRSGLNIRSGVGQPGYKGELIFSIKNEGTSNVTVELGARLIHAQFNLVQGKGNEYRGQWQHGRVTTGGKEKQI